MFWFWVLIIGLAVLSLLAYVVHQGAKSLGIDKHPGNIAFLNLTVNCLTVSWLFTIIYLLGW
jgi:hypothetical protein